MILLHGPFLPSWRVSAGGHRGGCEPAPQCLILKAPENERWTLPLSPQLWDGRGLAWFPTLWSQENLTEALQFLTHKGKFTCTVQGTALFPAKLLTQSQTMEEEDEGEEEEWARVASVMGELHIPQNPECSVFWSHPWEPHVHVGPEFLCSFVPSEWGQNSLLSEDGQRAKRKLALDNNNIHSYSFCGGWTSLFWEHREINWV